MIEQASTIPVVRVLSAIHVIPCLVKTNYKTPFTERIFHLESVPKINFYWYYYLLVPSQGS